jgi:cell division protein FtsB
MPSSTEVNRRKKPPKKQEPRFLRKQITGHGPGSPAKILRILGWTLAIWFGSAILLGDSGLFSIFQMRGMKGSLRDEVEALESKRDETAEYRDALANDPEMIEKVARETYGMIKDGEVTYRVTLGDED